MQVRPEYKSFGELFSENNVFFTPKYQRDYSWESEQIEQFCGDIKNALNLEALGQHTQHFFGGIVFRIGLSSLLEVNIKSLFPNGR